MGACVKEELVGICQRDVDDYRLWNGQKASAKGIAQRPGIVNGELGEKEGFLDFGYLLELDECQLRE
jgi:hypothetical protein